MTKESRSTGSGDYVTLPRKELEAMVTRDEVEGMVKALLQRERNSIQLPKSPAAQEAPMQRVDCLPLLVEPEASETSAMGTRTLHFSGDVDVICSRDSLTERTEVGSSGWLDLFSNEPDDQPVVAATETTSEGRKKEEEHEWHAPFKECVYTLLYMHKARSQSFCYGIFVFLLKVAMISLTLMGELDNDADNNPLQVPPMVSPTVTCAQALILFLSLACMNDLIEAVLKLQDGFYPEILQKHPGATFSTWLFSCLAQLFLGLLLLAAIFILTMQTDNVVEAMLNFAAFHFVNDIDNLGFYIAKKGFITNQLQFEVMETIDVQVPKRKVRNLYRRVLYLLTLIGLCVGFIIIKKRQLDGQCLPTFIYVQFGDVYNPQLQRYSGILSSGNVRTSNYREYRDMGNVLLNYCKEEKAWTFSKTNDPCTYFAKSDETESYDVTSLTDSEWHIKYLIGRLQPFDSFHLFARDCDPAICQGSCGADGHCECPHDRFGMECEFSDVCQDLGLDTRFEQSDQVKFEDPTGVSEEFHMLQNPATGEFVRVYDMPVWYANTTFPAQLIFFRGNHWVVTNEWGLFNITEARLNSPSKWSFQEATIATLEKEFSDYHQAEYKPLFISDPVDFEAPDFKPAPVSVRWRTVQEGNNHWSDKEGNPAQLQSGTLGHYALAAPVTTVFNCQTPSCLGKEKGFCGFGWCDESNGKCQCEDDYEGDRCESPKPCYEQRVPCGGHGACDNISGYCRCDLPYYGKVCQGN